MKILVLDQAKPEFPMEELLKELKPEAEAIYELYQEGHFREIYLRGDVMGGVFIMEAESVEAADKLLQRLPLYDKLNFTTIPLNPTAIFDVLLGRAQGPK